ncbi:hypothetical protein [Fusibacter sp. 3D3]|uniref:hypothetical protein n=1 Tax=Fusibacter sp. 3D3 TaxID=1048380 RepID=UPI0015867DC6|nr:hypothetical protein [Fusibacter sp. 3D3]
MKVVFSMKTLKASFYLAAQWKERLEQFLEIDEVVEKPRKNRSIIEEDFIERGSFMKPIETRNLCQHC